MNAAAAVHRRIVELYPEVVRTGELGPGLALIDPDVVDHRGGVSGDHVGIDAWREKWEAMVAPGRFRDVGVTIEQNVSEGDMSVNRYTSRGTEIATGRRYEVTSMDMVRVSGGRIVEHWALMDVPAMQAQLEG